jgi:hypothetical protein
MSYLILRDHWCHIFVQNVHALTRQNLWFEEGNKDTINRNTKTLTDASKEVCLEINIPNRSFENVSQFKYLGTTITNQNLIKDNIKRRLNSGKVCYLLSSRLLSKHVEIAIDKTIILPL